MIKYKNHDKHIIFNDDDKDLKPIKVKLPSPPKDIKEIIGHGLPNKEQKFKRPFIPNKLFELNKRKDLTDGEKVKILRAEYKYYEEEIDFINQEWKRRLNGVWYYINGKPTYIPGCYYFFLTAWYLERSYPEFRERDNKFFIFAEFCENDKDCYGFIYPKFRREGATTKSACWNYEYISRNRRTRGGIQSKTEADGQMVFSKHLVAGWRKLPFWYRPVFEGSTNPAAKLSFNAPPVKVTRTNMGLDNMDDLESSIDFMASTEGAYDGSRLERYHGDEIGKCIGINVYKRHLVVRQCLSVRDEIIGKAIYTSTAGEMTKGGGAEFKKLIEASDYHGERANNRTTSGLYTLFIPSTEGYMIDEFGNSKKKESLKWLLEERKQALEEEDYEKLNESTRQFPIRLRDCFRNASDTDNFNMKIIQEQLDKYQFGNTDITIGDFIWQDGNVGGRVIFEPRENGKFKVSYLFENPEHSNRFYTEEGIKFPANDKKFIAGGDTFKFKTTQGGKKSLGGGSVFMKRDYTIDKDSDPIEEWKTHRFVCTYLYRPRTKDEYCEDMLLMSIYYGCRMCPEINVPAIMDHFERRGYPGYLHYVYDKKARKYKKNPGYNTGTEVREAIYRAYQQFVEKHGHRLVHDDLLTQLQEIDDDMGDYDLFVAGGMCLIAEEDEQNFFLGEEEEDGDDINDFFHSREL